ncbi:MAG: hypothetical protein ACO263_08730, partial [Cyclobacteriaceae bacterium]
NLPSAGAFTTGAVESSDIAKRIAEGKVGGLFNIKGISNVRDMQKIAVEKVGSKFQEMEQVQLKFQMAD